MLRSGKLVRYYSPEIHTHWMIQVAHKVTLSPCSSSSLPSLWGSSIEDWHQSFIGGECQWKEHARDFNDNVGSCYDAPHLIPTASTAQPSSDQPQSSSSKRHQQHRNIKAPRPISPTPTPSITAAFLHSSSNPTSHRPCRHSRITLRSLFRL